MLTRQLLQEPVLQLIRLAMYPCQQCITLELLLVGLQGFCKEPPWVISTSQSHWHKQMQDSWRPWSFSGYR